MILSYMCISDDKSPFIFWPLHGSVVECWTSDIEVPGLSVLVLCRSVLRQDTSEPKPSAGKTQEIHVNCHHDLTEMIMNVA